MTERDYNRELYEKMKSEQGKYRSWLLAQEPSVILDYAYAYAMREDIVLAMEELNLSPKRAKALLKSPCPLADVYEEFRDCETNQMVTIIDTIESRADQVIQCQKERDGR
jgi:hypothetical protein